MQVVLPERLLNMLDISGNLRKAIARETRLLMAQVAAKIGENIHIRHFFIVYQYGLSTLNSFKSSPNGWAKTT